MINRPVKNLPNIWITLTWIDEWSIPKSLPPSVPHKQVEALVQRRWAQYWTFIHTTPIIPKPVQQFTPQQEIYQNSFAYSAQKRKVKWRRTTPYLARALSIVPWNIPYCCHTAMRGAMNLFRTNFHNMTRKGHAWRNKHTIKKDDMLKHQYSTFDT